MVLQCEPGGRAMTDVSPELQPLKPRTSNVDISYILQHPNSHNRNFDRRSSVILPSGERVHRSLSFTNSNYESFANATIEDESLEESEAMYPLIQLNISLSNKLRLMLAYSYAFILNLYNDGKFKNVIKCSITYLLASLGVYWQPFNHILGNSDFKHVICTVVVYFHPSRTKGSMHITLMYVFISLCFSFIVSFGCRFLSSQFYVKGNEEISYIIDLFISSTSLGFIAYMKQKVNQETFNTACSLASISIVACIVKEGSLNGAVVPLERLTSTLKIVVIGCGLTVIVCYTLFPQDSVKLVKQDLSECYNLMSSALSVVASTFLTGEKLSVQNNEMFNKLNNKLRNMEKNLTNAKYELLLVGKECEWDKLQVLVKITKSLTTHLLALRSSTEMQWQLLHEDIINSSDTSVETLGSNIAISQSVENLSKIGTTNQQGALNDQNTTDGDLEYVVMSSGQIFDLFVYYLAPSIKSFIFTIKTVLNDKPFDNDGSIKFNKSLISAINLFEDKQLKSFEKLYNQEVFKSQNDLLFKSDLEEVTACCGNFSSLLQLFGKELSVFLEELSDYKHRLVDDDVRSWTWLKFWDSSSKPLLARTNTSRDINDALLSIQNQYNYGGNQHINDFRFNLWKWLKFMRRTDIQFGLRVGLGAFGLSIFAFYPPTKMIFNAWRCEWALTIYCIMMNKSLGGTRMTIKWRFLGTFLGSIIAYIIWLLFDGHPVALGLTGFLISVPCFYIIIYWKTNNAFGRFILLTYNLTALFSYTIEQHDQEDDNEGGDTPIIGEIAFHRFIAVSIGIIWAVTMASIFIPNSARIRLKNGLTIIWLRLGIIWDSDPLDYTFNSSGGQYRLVNLKGEHGLNSLLNELEVLLKQSPLEFRLKGKFPSSLYSKLVTYTSNIIDAYHNMMLMIDIDPILNENEEYVIKYLEQERHELEHRIFLIFYMIASSLKLQFPLPSKPASTEHAKDRMLYKLNEIRSKSNDLHKDMELSNEDYVLLYSYILVSSTIVRELDKIIEVIKQLLGDINEEMFQLV